MDYVYELGQVMRRAGRVLRRDRWARCAACGEEIVGVHAVRTTTGFHCARCIGESCRRCGGQGWLGDLAERTCGACGGSGVFGGAR